MEGIVRIEIVAWPTTRTLLNGGPEVLEFRYAMILIPKYS